MSSLAAKPALKRTLGLFEVTTAGVGIILGAGIYVLIGIASGYAGNAVWMSFLIASIISIFTGLSYAELSSIFKEDCGEYEYIEKSFGKAFAWVVGIMVILTGVISGAAVALGFGSYFHALTNLPIIPLAAAIVFLFSIVNFLGIRQSSRVNILFTFIEIVGLVIIILFGLKFFGNVNYFDMANGFHGVLKATALIFFAYMGFETVVKLAEETKNPTKTIPKALILSIIISSVIYILVAISAVSIVGWEVLSASKAPLAEAAGKAFFGNSSFLVLAIIALFSTSNTVLMILVTTSRLTYGLAEKQCLPKQLAIVHQEKRTPWVAIAAVGFAALLFTLIGKIDFVANLNDVFLFLTFAGVNLAALVLRYKMPEARRKFRVPLNIGNFSLLSLFGFFASLFMAFYAIGNLF